MTGADPGGASAYDDALSQFLDYELAAGPVLKQVVADHPDLVMASVLRGAMMLMVEASGTQRSVSAMATALLNGRSMTGRERGHVTALTAWAAGDLRGAAQQWDRILADEPLDLLALKLHHYTTFWTGRATALRSTVDGVRPFWDEATPGFDHVIGMQAFALNECGRYEEAGRIGRLAVDRNREDLWSIHAVAHSLEMLGDHKAGVEFFDELTVAAHGDLWATKNPFRGHLWWHAALFPYGAGLHDQVLALYDERIVPSSTDFYLDIQNRVSLLARLELAGVDVGDRWGELGQHAVDRTGDHVLTFTDVHCCLALARTGRLDELERYLASLTEHRTARLTREPAIDTADLDIAIPLGHGLLHDAAGRQIEAAAIVLPLRDELAPIGGSHAQRDLFEMEIVDMVRRAGDNQMARQLLAARTGRWPDHEPTWRRYANVLAATGADDRAAAATARADAILTTSRQ